MILLFTSRNFMLYTIHSAIKDPMEIPKVMEQVPMPQLSEHSKPLQQLLAKTDEKNIVDRFVRQLINKGYSLNAIKNELGLPYNLIYEIAHGAKHPGSTEYQKKKAAGSKSIKGNKNQ